ncbi:hypothetical protein [Streptomyces sp. NPDC088707]|uniref:hypothetical protein n=1 Tax=Streptomyces sp. NPDC088707 TaxID=3365871 RepID=UPI003810D882
MTVYDYQPVYGGAACDPGSNGGSVSRIDLYTAPERTGAPAATAGPAARLRAATYRFTLPDLPDGRYWCTVTFTPGANTHPATDRTVKIDFPLGTGLLASAEQIADKLNVPLPLSAAQREAFRDAIADAQSDVAGHLGRPLLPTPRTLTDARPLFGYDLLDARAWPLNGVDDIVTVAGVTEKADDRYDVDLLVGLDAAAEKPIVRYVVAHAAETLRNDPAAGGGRRVTSVSAEGQSISYEAAPSAGQPGSLPTLDSLNDFRKLLLRPLPVVPAQPWPYGQGRRYTRW